MLKKGLLILILLLLWLPLMEKFCRYFKINVLNGAIVYHSKPVLSQKIWFTAGYQKEYELYFNDTIGFHNELIRLRNQIDYSLFNKCHSFDTEMGKEGFLFPVNQYATYLGKTKTAEGIFDFMIEKLAVLKDTLKAHNKNLILIFAPTKGAVHRSVAPDWCDDKKVAESDHDYLIRKARGANINCLDFYSWFNQGKFNYDVFTKMGAHWSTYAGALAGDSMVHYFEKLHKCDLPDVKFSRVEVVDTPRYQDDDLFKALNLFSQTPKDTYRYLTMQYEKSNKSKVNALFISDSFFFTFHYLPGEVFENYAFWFYNNRIYSDDSNHGKYVKDLDLKSEIDRYDDIVLMATEWNLANLGWGFIENALNLYGIKVAKSVDYFKRIIKNDAKWFKQIQEKAVKNKISVEEQLTQDANYMLSISK